MTDKKPGLIEAAEGYLYNGGFGRYRFDLELALKSAKEREALVEAVVKAARELKCAMSEGAWKDEPRIGYDEVQINKWELREFKDALAALDRFDAGEGK